MQKHAYYVIEKQKCNKCNGTGVAPITSFGDPDVTLPDMECEKCHGTGITKKHVLLETAIQELLQQKDA